MESSQDIFRFQPSSPKLGDSYCRVSSEQIWPGGLACNALITVLIWPCTYTNKHPSLNMHQTGLKSVMVACRTGLQAADLHATQDPSLTTHALYLKLHPYEPHTAAAACQFALGTCSTTATILGMASSKASNVQYLY